MIGLKEVTDETIASTIRELAVTFGTSFADIGTEFIKDYNGHGHAHTIALSALCAAIGSYTSQLATQLPDNNRDEFMEAVLMAIKTMYLDNAVTGDAYDAH